MALNLSDERVRKMHPRQAAIFLEVAEADREAVYRHARLRMNVSGGNFSANLQLAVQALKQAGSAEALLAEDREDRAKLMNAKGI